MRRLFDFRGGFKLSSALYAVLTPAFFLAGASYVFAPQVRWGAVGCGVVRYVVR